jgi:hypothetical protein
MSLEPLGSAFTPTQDENLNRRQASVVALIHSKRGPEKTLCAINRRGGDALS